MKTVRKKLIAFICAFALCCTLIPSAFAADFTPAPTTAYATQFVQKCEGQQWFLNEVERLLNREQKTIDTLTSTADLASIKGLGLRDADITGVIPSAIGELTELRYLFLSGNHLSGTIPSELFTLPKLENIDLGGNDYSGAVPVPFGTMTSLKTLVLKGNDYTGTIPDAILSNTQITTLDLADNRLTGGVPANIANMTALEYLNLSENALGGEIPDLSALSNLLALSLWNCDLTGDIPESLYSLGKLQILDLSDNELTGEASASLANLTGLQYLTLDNNALRGTLPDAFTMTSLAEAHLEHNYLRGTVPASLKTRSDSGTVVYLNDNYMTGSVLKAMENNAGNFTDAAAMQYQLSATKDWVQVSKNGTVNLYALLQNRALAGGLPVKVLLHPDEYTVTYNSSKLEITTDANGIYTKALVDLPKSDSFTVTIQIEDNNGSDYSAVKLKLTTDVAAVGGGGGGAPQPQTEEHKAYINGFPDGTFGGEKSVTREQVAKMLIDALGKETGAVTGTAFTDVGASWWSAPWVEAAAREGYVTGYSNGSFGPQKSITRAELATVLVRIAAKDGRMLSEKEKTFTDVPETEWYVQSVNDAVRYGLITGYEDGTFRPNQSVTRAEAVTMINRLLERDYKTAVSLKTAVCPFPDVQKTDWAYGDIMEASVTHEH